MPIGLIFYTDCVAGFLATDHFILMYNFIFFSDGSAQNVRDVHRVSPPTTWWGGRGTRCSTWSASPAWSAANSCPRERSSTSSTRTSSSARRTISAANFTVRLLILQCVIPSQQTRGVDPMAVQCWTSVEDAGPTLTSHWVNVLCLLVLHAMLDLR